MDILIVDDEIDLRESLDDVLTSVGFDAFTTSNGQEALTILSQYNFDLIITDINMPEIDGLELIRKVKRERELPVKIIAMSGGDKYLLEKAIQLGADKTLTKPFRFDELLNAICNLFLELHSVPPHRFTNRISSNVVS